MTEEKELAPSYIELVLCERTYNPLTGKWTKDTGNYRYKKVHTGNEALSFFNDVCKEGKTVFKKPKKKKGGKQS